MSAHVQTHLFSFCSLAPTPPVVQIDRRLRQSHVYRLRTRASPKQTTHTKIFKHVHIWRNESVRQLLQRIQFRKYSQFLPTSSRPITSRIPKHGTASHAARLIPRQHSFEPKTNFQAQLSLNSQGLQVLKLTNLVFETPPRRHDHVGMFGVVYSLLARLCSVMQIHERNLLTPQTTGVR